MPTHTPVQANLIPKAAEPPIPVRVVQTRPANLTQPTISETPVVESTPTAESVTLSQQASAAARKEQAYRQREAVLKQREADLEAKLKQAEQYSQLKSKLATKDYSEAEALGLNYEGYTEYLLAKQAGESQPEPYKKLEAEIETIKKQQAEKATHEYEETVAEYQKEIASTVSSNPEFSSIKEMKREDAVLQLILDSWEQDGTEMTIEEASKDVEEFLISQAKEFSSLSKIKTEPAKLPRPGLKTLTQQVNVGADKAPLKPLHSLSDAERYVEARRRALAKRQG